MFTLRAEIAACLFAVSLLGLLAGWMMQRARMSRQLDAEVEQWEARHAALEQSTRQDERNLEEQLQSLGDELKAARVENRELREAAHRNDDSADMARTESIEMNRRHAEVQERLQRTLRERDSEIASLRETMASHDDTLPEPSMRNASTLNERDDVLDATIRIDPMQLPGASTVAPARSRPPEEVSAQSDDALESTLSVGYLDADEATIALDDEALAMVHGMQGGHKR